MGSDNNIKIDNDQLAGFTEELRADRFIDDLFAPTRWNLFLLSNMWMNETKRRLQATLLAYSTNKVNARAVQHALTQFEEATAGSRDARNSLSSQMIEEHDPDVTPTVAQADLRKTQRYMIGRNIRSVCVNEELAAFVRLTLKGNACN